MLDRRNYEIASLIRHNLDRNADDTDVIYMLSRREKEMRAALEAWEAEAKRIVANGTLAAGFPAANSLQV